MINRLSKVLEIKKMSGAELARRIGISTDRLWKIANGVHDPSGKEMQAIAETFHLPVNYIFEE